MPRASRIMVVDDDPAARARVVRALGRVGYAVASCGSARAAIRLASTFRPDVVVLEMLLRGQIAGEELARRLRAEDDPLLLFATRDSNVADRLAAFEAGADDYLVKPFVLDELIARVRALLRRSGRSGSHVVEVGRLLVDEPAHRVIFAGNEIRLRPIEFSLLAVLARHAGQVLSKRRLLEQVWGYDAVDENLVEVHVSTLRRQLGRAATVIHTIRGIGYVLRDDHS